MFGLEGWFDRLKVCLMLSAALFLGSMVAGWLVGLLSPEFTEGFVEGLGEGFGWLRGQPRYVLTMVILINNAGKCLGAVLLGPLFGLAPLGLSVVNGFVLGLVAFVVGSERGVTFLAASLLPHGVFEVPALLVSVAAGLWEGWLMVKKLSGEPVSLLGALRDGLRLYFRVALPLLVVAAFVEGYVTPEVMRLVP